MDIDVFTPERMRKTMEFNWALREPQNYMRFNHLRNELMDSERIEEIRKQKEKEIQEKMFGTIRID